MAELHIRHPIGQAAHSEPLGNIPLGHVAAHALVTGLRKVPTGHDVQTVADVHSRQLAEHREHEPVLR